ncbi:hypothetical protein [Flavivirga eckloniae]|uniref:Uncharacterized protein n=1 Tax=Flavivirga eckloniae TaxID=1803846 RepID=A0A2K9PSP4_9FLAO|nr:hypothetical protein [Flavivirga eckloniae]AUP80092.1 hypothetical protein C1H87_15805 [Flavivirga eckloniae]
MTKEQINFWKENILNSIKSLADLELQRITWTGKHPTIVSSFSETINTLYDDCEFKQYIDYIGENRKDEEEIYSKMLRIDILIEEYLKVDKKDIEVLNDPEWENITQKALEIISLWIVPR